MARSHLKEYGQNNFMAKAFGVFMPLDKLVGADFEKGLASLDAATSGSQKNRQMWPSSSSGEPSPRRP